MTFHKSGAEDFRKAVMVAKSRIVSLLSRKGVARESELQRLVRNRAVFRRAMLELIDEGKVYIVHDSDIRIVYLD